MQLKNIPILFSNFLRFKRKEVIFWLTLPPCDVVWSASTSPKKRQKKAPFFLLISLPLPIPYILRSAHWNEPSVYLSGKPKEVISVVLFAVKVCVLGARARPKIIASTRYFFLLKIISASSPSRGRKWTIMLVKLSLCVWYNWNFSQKYHFDLAGIDFLKLQKH